MPVKTSYLNLQKGKERKGKCLSFFPILMFISLIGLSFPITYLSISKILNNPKVLSVNPVLWITFKAMHLIFHL